MDIQKEKASLKERQEAVVKGLNEVIAQEQALAQQKQQLIEEALRLNGEARLLNRLDGDKGK
jgi:peptidoglycan hydrolase CwlO-like protein